MIQYHVREDTPLKFHKFFRFLAIPAVIIYGIQQLISLFGEISNNYYLIDIGYWLITIVLSSIVFVCCYYWSPAAWYCVMALIALRLLYSLVVVTLLILLRASSSAIGGALGQVFGWLFWYIPVGIYYLKRKPLFFLFRD